MRRHLAVVVLAFVATAAIDARADPVDDYIRARMAALDLPGMSLVVMKDGKTIKAAAYGVTDKTTRSAATTETVYKIASVSKQFIATGIMLLAQDGRLKVTDPASKYLEGTPPTWSAITIRHLLSHTAGLARESPAFDMQKLQPEADVVRALYPVPLRFTPGAQWEYSNSGYFMLAEIITRVSGRTWDRFLNDRVFSPARMTATSATHVAPLPAKRAVGYTGRNNERAAGDWIASRPSGAFYSTVTDLAKWEGLFRTNRILNEASRQQMWTSVNLADGSPAKYGYGWHVETKNGRRVVWHGGGVPGFSSYYLRVLEQGLTLILLANGEDLDPIQLGDAIAELYLK